MFNSPVTESQLHRLMSVQPKSAIDIGCGDGSLLNWLSGQFSTSGMGVDKDEAEIANANSNSSGKQLQFLARSFDVNDFKDKKFQLAACIGSTHIFAEGELALKMALEGMKPLTENGGFILIGDCYWRKEPSSEYLKIFGGSPPAYRSHQDNIELIHQAGLKLISSDECSTEQWDDFESRHQKKLKARFSQISDNEERAKKEKFLELWNHHYEKWGRETLGFGLYLART